MLHQLKQSLILLTLAAILLLTSCHSLTNKHSIENSTPSWEGRIAIKILQPKASNNSLSFELAGNAIEGELTLNSSFGITVASITWNPQFAIFSDGKQQQVFMNLEQLLQEKLAINISSGALFAWLNGQPYNLVGWQVDLSAHSHGRIKLTQDNGQRSTQILIKFNKLTSSNANFTQH